jgi:hypothetical protein
LHISENFLLYTACEAGTATDMSKRNSFEEAADSLLAAFANVGGGAVNSNRFNVHEAREHNPKNAW